MNKQEFEEFYETLKNPVKLFTEQGDMILCQKKNLEFSEATQQIAIRNPSAMIWVGKNLSA